ncbi:MAG TPA: hypothetical protein VN026_14865 [Bacteroidia bacterium]|jgi:hypothetical protein|nr:hypothetical protein [Bacteroidia bacterium]
MPSIKNVIINEINNISNSLFFKSWIKEENISKTNASILIINNSFIFREKVKTNKNSKYLCMDIDSSGKFNPKDVYIVEGIGINSLYKIMVAPDNINKINIDLAIKNELEEIGEIVFSLIGEIHDVNQIIEPIQNENLKIIKLDPLQSNLFNFNEGELKIKEIDDREKVWEYVETLFNSNDWEITDSLSAQVDKAISNIQSDAYSTLVIPAKINAKKEYLLDKISKVINEHIISYKASVVNIETDPGAMNEILRISYNFVSDVNKLLTLIINICDLKPLVLWTTISKHNELDNKFKELPFGLNHYKPSLSSYESIIKNARNKSFHQLFPFNKSLQMELASLQQVTLRLFSSHGSKKAPNRLTYKDQDLYEILLGFTRVNEQSVSSNFWVKNEEIMQSINNLIQATSKALKDIKKSI